MVGILSVDLLTGGVLLLDSIPFVLFILVPRLSGSTVPLPLFRNARLPSRRYSPFTYNDCHEK